MDFFCEYLVKKQSSSDNLKRVGLAFACGVVCIVIIYISLFLYHGLLSAMPLMVAAAIYGTVILSRNYSLEYEYIFTNGVLDIDVIKGRARRKKLISVPCRRIEYMGPVDGVTPSGNKIVNAMYNLKRGNKYVVTFSDQGEMTDLYFQPPEKILNYMQKYNPRNIHL